MFVSHHKRREMLIDTDSLIVPTISRHSKDFADAHLSQLGESEYLADF